MARHTFTCATIYIICTQNTGRMNNLHRENRTFLELQRQNGSSSTNGIQVWAFRIKLTQAILTGTDWHRDKRAYVNVSTHALGT